jgi:hypothetical protein
MLFLLLLLALASFLLLPLMMVPFLLLPLALASFLLLPLMMAPFLLPLLALASFVLLPLMVVPFLFQYWQLQLHSWTAMPLLMLLHLRQCS